MLLICLWLVLPRHIPHHKHNKNRRNHKKTKENEQKTRKYDNRDDVTNMRADDTADVISMIETQAPHPPMPFVFFFILSSHLKIANDTKHHIYSEWCRLWHSDAAVFWRMRRIMVLPTMRVHMRVWGCFCRVTFESKFYLRNLIHTHIQ